MKKYVITLITLLTCTFLAACGDNAEQESAWIGIAPGADLTAVTERTEYYDLTIESEELFDFGLWEKNPEQYYASDVQRGITLHHLLGTQFAMGEPTQIWSEVSSAGVDICLYRTDGSRELLIHGLSDNDNCFADARFSGYVDQDRNCYFYRTDYLQINGEYRYVGTVMKILSTDEIEYTNTLEPGFQIEDICQMEDGSIYLLLTDRGNDKEVLAELDPDTGQLDQESRMEWDMDGGWNSYLGAVGVSPARVSSSRIETVDVASQSTFPLLYADGTSYGSRGDREIQDFRVLEDGTMEFLWTDNDGRNCVWERQRMEKVEKTPVVLRGIFGDDFWLSEKVTQFNQKSSEYHVVLESCSYGNNSEDFARLTNVQIGAGKGPDILCGNDLLHDYISGMLDKGALEALNPYMEASGILEEDYFPLTFATWRQGAEIYSVTPRMWLWYQEMDAEVLGSGETPDIETLMDALLAREESAVYRKWFTSGEVLNTFLEGSENLWGMVDWETGSCDFNVALFGKLLEVAGRYGYDDRKSLYPEITYFTNLDYFFSFNSPAEQEEKGRVSIETLFDDGCHAVSYPSYTMAINANSANKEGAWEFIAFLLGEDVQYREELYLPPVHKESFDKWLEWELSWLCEVRYENGKQLYNIYYEENTSEEKREAYKKAIEDARPLPVRTAPILTIILDDAEDYFNGSKSAEEVSQVISNRVQLYLDEKIF